MTDTSACVHGRATPYMQVIYKVTRGAKPAVRLCSEAGRAVRRAAAMVALTCGLQRFQMVTAL
jgi:hypothetical protein